MKLQLIILVSVMTAGCAAQQTNTEVAQLIDQRYIFKAQNALPSGGSLVPLTEGYDLRVSRDTVIAYLPYYGRAYSINPYSGESGIKFTSSDFSYKTKKRNNGSWQITIEPKDHSEVQQLYLNISPSGFTSLMVQPLNRQPISFNGYITRWP